MTNPFASVVVPTWNRSALLQDTVISLLNQDYASERYEVIVVDDGSADTTALVLQGLRKTTQPAILYLEQPHRGPNAARNLGIAKARGDLICLIDDDVELPPGWLSAIVAAAMRHPEADCIGGPIRLRFEGRTPRLCGREPLGETELDLGNEEIVVKPQRGRGRWEGVWSANMVIRRKSLERAGLFDERLGIYGDELEWELRLQGKGGLIMYAPQAWLWHRRTSADLRLGHLLANRFRRGRNIARAETIAGAAVSPAGQLVVAARMLLHWMRRRCAWGLISAMGHIGYAYGRIRLSS